MTASIVVSQLVERVVSELRVLPRRLKPDANGALNAAVNRCSTQNQVQDLVFPEAKIKSLIEVFDEWAKWCPSCCNMLTSCCGFGTCSASCAAEGDAASRVSMDTQPGNLTLNCPA
jgi:hypothetical protein